jgi:hypothetical protein
MANHVVPVVRETKSGNKVQPGDFVVAKYKTPKGSTVQFRACVVVPPPHLACAMTETDVVVKFLRAAACNKYHFFPDVEEMSIVSLNQVSVTQQPRIDNRGHYYFKIVFQICSSIYTFTFFPLEMLISNVDLGKPLEVNTKIGDGNCLYRGFSLEICGTQAHHEQVRAIIVDFMLKNLTKFATYVGEDLGQYIARNNLALNTWGSDAEIYAAATLLQTPVVYTAVSETTRQWLTHMPLFSITGVEVAQERVYLRNLCGHFERVVSVT